MRTFRALATATVLAGATSFFIPPLTYSADAPARSEAAAAAAAPMLPDGFTPKSYKDNDDIRAALAGLTQNALTSDGFKDVVGDLIDADQTRIGKYKDRKADELNAKVTAIRDLWKQRYGHDFDIKSAKEVFQPEMVKIARGEVSDSARAAATWPVDPATGKPMEKTPEAVAAAAHESAKTLGGKTDLDKGRSVALAAIVPSHGLPAVTLSLVHELPDSWRFDIPDARTGEQIYSSLVTQLEFIASHSAEWPAKESAAYDAVGHRVVMALTGIDGGAPAPAK
jgi:hypothetical protein